MKENILIQDLYMNCTYSSEMSIQRRFFVVFKVDDFVIRFMSEMNSSFQKYSKLENTIVIESDDFDKIKKEKSSKTIKNMQLNKLLKFNNDDYEKYVSANSLIINHISRLDSKKWLFFCEDMYKREGKVFNESARNFEEKIFIETNEKLKETWKNFPSNINIFSIGGEWENDFSNPKNIYKLQQFEKIWIEDYYNYVNKKNPEKNIIIKKMKI